MNCLPNSKPYYNKAQAAKHLKVSLPDIENLIASGRLKVIVMGKLHLIPADSMQSFLQKQNSPDSNLENSAKKNSEVRKRVTEAGQRLNKSINQINEMVARGELIVDSETGNLVLVSDFTKAKVSIEGKDKEECQEGAVNTESPKLESPHADEEKSSTLTSTKKFTDDKSARIRELEEWVQDLQNELQTESKEGLRLTEQLDAACADLMAERTESKRLTDKLEWEQEEHRRNLKNARYELDQLEAQIENWEREEKLDPSLDNFKREQAARREADQRAKELYEELAAERASRLKAEQELKDMHDLEGKLAASQQHIASLEADALLLANIRGLMDGAPSTIQDPPNIAGEEALSIQTAHGLWNFRPPFQLDSREVELLRLVAGEDEISAEQIKTRTGRRRAVDELDELLDRLLEEGLEPIFEENDVYRFDEDFLRDEE